MPILETRALCKSYPAGSRESVAALDGLSLEIERGDFVVVNGPSGSGKTTLLALLGGLEKPTSGRVYFEGTDLSTCSDVERTRVRRRMGLVFQDFALLPNLSALENITYALLPRRVPIAERHKRAHDMLVRFGLGNRLAARARDLSGGEQQRVAIARALAGHPEVLLADEPTSNLDAATTGVLLAVFQELHREEKTLIVASHDPRLHSLASRVVELEKGRLKEGWTGD